MKINSALGAFLLIATPSSAQNVFDPMALPAPPVMVEPPLPHGMGPPQLFGPRFENALRHQIEAIEAGQPDYDAMTPNTADQLRGQFSQIHPAPAQQWGVLVSLKFRNGTSKADVYEARFERARVRWIIAQNRQGKITGIAFKTLS